MRFLFCILLLTSMLAAGAQSKTVTTNIKEVTVYQQGARIQRTGSVTLAAGRNELQFSREGVNGEWAMVNCK